VVTEKEAKMSTEVQQPVSPGRDGHAVFSRVLVGIDASAESREAARQASILAEGSLTLLAAYDIAAALVGGTGINVPAYYDEKPPQAAAKDALRRAREEIDELRSAYGKIARGSAWDELLREIEREHDTLVAVGTHGHGRAVGIVLSSTPTELIHKAPCSVLVARKTSGSFPKRIVVGVDGSPESAAAYEVAKHIAEAHGGKVWPVVAYGGEGVAREAVDAIIGDRREDSPDEPVRALVAAAAGAHLLVVGSRGLHGLKSLGSVSERVAHQAGCSVLVVRGV
jgi:nucleotide-binding universal stress UspA family protein